MAQQVQAAIVLAQVGNPAPGGYVSGNRDNLLLGAQITATVLNTTGVNYTTWTVIPLKPNAGLSYSVSGATGPTLTLTPPAGTGYGDVALRVDVYGDQLPNGAANVATAYALLGLRAPSSAYAPGVPFPHPLESNLGGATTFDPAGGRATREAESLLALYRVGVAGGGGGGGPSYTQPDSSTLLHWTCDEAAGATTLANSGTGTSADLTVQGAGFLPMQDLGLFKNATFLLRDGGSNTRYWQSGALAPVPSGAFTLSVWVRPKATVGAGYALASRPSGGVLNALGWGTNGTDLYPQFYHQNPAGGSYFLQYSNLANEPSAENRLAFDVWNLIAVTWDGTTLALYCNGDLVATSTPSAPFGGISATIWALGADPAGTVASTMDAWIDDPRVETVARTAAYIQAMYAGSGGGAGGGVGVGAANQVLTTASAGGALQWATIKDANVDPAAAIQGSKIVSLFGSQPVTGSSFKAPAGVGWSAGLTSVSVTSASGGVLALASGQVESHVLEVTGSSGSGVTVTVPAASAPCEYAVINKSNCTLTVKLVSDVGAGVVIPAGQGAIVYSEAGAMLGYVFQAGGAGSTPTGTGLPHIVSGVQNAAASAVTSGDIDGTVASTAALTAALLALTTKAPARLATAAALPANTYSNGTSGVGATLTANANGALTVDGIAVVTGDRLLIQNEATAANNGLYVATSAGSAGSAWVLTRSADANTAALLLGASVLVVAGSTNNTAIFDAQVDLTATLTVGTTAIPWGKIGGSGGGTSYSAGTGLGLTGTTFSLNSALSGALGGIRLAGDLGGVASAPSVLSINGSSVPAGGALTTGHVLKVVGAGALGYGYLSSANVDSSIFLSSGANALTGDVAGGAHKLKNFDSIEVVNGIRSIVGSPFILGQGAVLSLAGSSGAVSVPNLTQEYPCFKLTGSPTADTQILPAGTLVAGVRFKIFNACPLPHAVLVTIGGLWLPPGMETEVLYDGSNWQYASGQGNAVLLTGGVLTVPIAGSATSGTGTATWKLPIGWRISYGGMKYKTAGAGGFSGGGGVGITTSSTFAFADIATTASTALVLNDAIESNGDNGGVGLKDQLAKYATYAPNLTTATTVYLGYSTNGAVTTAYVLNMSLGAIYLP